MFQRYMKYGLSQELRIDASTLWRSEARITKAYDVTIKIYPNSHEK